MINEFDVGDYVRRESSVHRMKVERIGDFTQGGGPVHGAVCSWTDNEDQFQKELFDISTLVPVHTPQRKNRQ